jgi:hypothetical protein
MHPIFLGTKLMFSVDMKEEKQLNHLDLHRDNQMQLPLNSHRLCAFLRNIVLTKIQPFLG